MDEALRLVGESPREEGTVLAEPLSFEAFFEDQARTLFRRLCAVTGNAAEAEEIMQDAFLALWERWDRVSTLADPTGYLYRTAMNVFRRRRRRAAVDPGGPPFYAGTHYVLLGTIVEHVTGRPLAEVVRSDVLDDPGLDGLVYTVEDALASDGWGVRATPGSLARWGYELYGGFVLSDASLREMTDFQGEWYGLGVMDLSSDYATLAVGHEGESSVLTCCSVVRLVALPEEGMVISVQANTEPTDRPYDTYNSQVVSLTQTLRDAARG